MKKLVYSDYQEMSKAAAEFVAKELKDGFVLGLPTGSTPIGMYDNLAGMVSGGKACFDGVTFFNLDEYYPLENSNPESYAYFMNKHLFSRIGVGKDRANIPNGEAPDAGVEAAAYDKRIQDAGGINLMVLGVGVNGHIGFNEPAEELSSATHLTDLTQSTIEANSRNFPSIDDVPKKAITMGLGSIFAAEKILLLVSGENKREVVAKMFSGAITTQVPATLLALHRDVTVMVTKDADA